jgi:hypothetical protein
MGVLIGLDVGWSERRRTCGVALRGGSLAERGTVEYADVAAVALNKRDVGRALGAVVRRTLKEGQRVLVVTDAIVGPHRVPPVDRRVDAHCSIQGFYGRAQSYPATQNAGAQLSATLHDILDELLAGTGAQWSPWLGDGSPPLSGVVVTETNPTTSMALSLPMADRGLLPTRNVHRVLADGTRVRAKSDWYWRLGAGVLAAESLGVPGIDEESHHERVAALWCLALAHELDTSGRVALLGDQCGTYLVGPIDPSWVADAERVGVRWGRVHLGKSPLRTLHSTQHPVVDISDVDAESNDEVCDADDDALRGDSIRVHFTDNGGLTRKANLWIDSVDIPCRLRLRGNTTAEITMTPFAPPNDRSQFKVGPRTIPDLMRAWNGPTTLSRGDDFAVLGEVL